MMKPLESVFQHGSVGLFQEIAPDFDDIVRSDRQEVLVEGGVMELAEGYAVAGHGLAFGVAVRNDVRCVEQHAVLQPAERALLAIGMQNSLAKGLLMNALAGETGNVAATDFGVGLYG